MLTFEVHGEDRAITLDSYDAVVAGYTARDQEAVEHHIEELARIGVPRPPQTPMFYPVSPENVTSDPAVAITSEATSGEVEPVVIRHDGRYYLGIGSDHTDRQLETEDIGKSKQACPKPIGRTVLPIEDLETFTLDAFHAECVADGELYQSGRLGSLRDPGEVIPLMERTLGLDGGDFVCLGGTLPLLEGAFRYATTWEITLRRSSSPSGEDAISHHYTIDR